MKAKWSRLTVALLLLSLLLGGCGEDKQAAADEQEEQAEQTDQAADQTADGADQTAAEEESEPESTGTSEAMELLRSCDPETLGLAGDSMSDYEVVADDSVALVDGKAHLKLAVYREHAKTATNEVQGLYLLAKDYSGLYRLSPQEGTIETLELPELPELAAPPEEDTETEPPTEN